jgi:hypothetical protein
MRSLVLAFLLALPWNAAAFSQKTPPGSTDIGTTVETITGLKVTRQGNQVKVSVPQTDLQVRLDGWSITPPMGLSSWAAFAPTPKGAMVMGDFVLEGNEIAPVEKVLLDNGLTATGLHIHFRPKFLDLPVAIRS